MSLDKLYLGSDQVLDQKSLDFIRAQSPFRLRDNIYKIAYSFRVGEGQIVLKTDPVHEEGNASSTRIEFNPSRFGCLNDVMNVLSLFIDPDSLLIKRIDHAADLQIPLTVVHQCVRVKFKQDAVIYWESHKKEVMTGMYLGNKPEVHCYYDKGFELLGKQKAKRVTGNEVGSTTRFEVRQFKKKIPFPRFMDIRKYIDQNPYEKVQFLEMDTSAHTKKSEALKTLLSSGGLNNLYHELNSQSNARRLLKEMSERDLSAELYGVYRENLRQFFGMSVNENEEEESKVDKSRFTSRYNSGEIAPLPPRVSLGTGAA